MVHALATVASLLSVAVITTTECGMKSVRARQIVDNEGYTTRNS